MFHFANEPGLPDYSNYFCTVAKLEASYKRCRAFKISPELAKPQKVIPKTAFILRLKDNSLLLAAAEQVITPHHYAKPQIDHIYILCDPELVTLKIFATPEVLVSLEEICVKPATVFTEESCGTNALALARENNCLIAIRGEQHYCKIFKDWWCVAGPVKNLSGKILGFFDISLHANKELVSTVALLRTLIEAIENIHSQLCLDQAGQKFLLLPLLPPEIEQKLSLRQQEVLQFLASGLTYKEIADKCSLSIQTVKTHCRNIYQRIGVNNPREFHRKICNRYWNQV